MDSKDYGRDLNAVGREHMGVEGEQPLYPDMGPYKGPDTNERGQELNAVAREHMGVEGPQPLYPDMGPYKGPDTDERGQMFDAVARDHGGTGSLGVVTQEAIDQDNMNRYGTIDQYEINAIDNLSKADRIENISEVLKDLSDAAIKKLIERRSHESFYLIQDIGELSAVKDKLEQKLSLDFAIITKALDMGVDLNSPDIDISNIMGRTDKRDISGVLEGYYTQLNGSNKSEVAAVNPLTGDVNQATEVLQSLDEYVKEKEVSNNRAM